MAWIRNSLFCPLFICLSNLIFGVEPPITALALTPNRQHYVTGSQAGMAVYRLNDHGKVRSLTSKLHHVHDLAFSPDGKNLLAVGGAPAELGEAELFAWPDGTLLQRWRLSDDLLYRAAWSSDSQWFACGGHKNLCVATNVAGQTMAQYTGHSRSVLAMAIMPGNQQLLSAGVDQTIQQWSLDGARQRTLNNHTATVTDLVLRTVANNEAVQLVSASEDRTVRLWQPDIGRMIKFIRLESIPRRVVEHPPNEVIAACDDGSLVVIDAEDMKVVRTFKTTVSPIYELVMVDSKVLVAGGNGVEHGMDLSRVPD